MSRELQTICLIFTFVSVVVGALIGYNLHVEAENRKLKEYELELRAMLYRDCINHPKSGPSSTWCKF